MIVAPSLHNVGGRSPIDLKIESQIPSKVRGPQNNKTSTRLSDGSFGGRARLCWTRASCRRSSGGGGNDAVAALLSLLSKRDRGWCISSPVRRTVVRFSSIVSSRSRDQRRDENEWEQCFHGARFYTRRLLAQCFKGGSTRSIARRLDWRRTVTSRSKLSCYE